MNAKNKLILNVFFSLSSAIILEVSGRDSTRYLNARLTCNIRDIQVGNTCLGAALNPQGRCEGLFQIYKKGDTDYLLWCDGGDRDKVVSAFKRYLVADRVDVKDLSKALFVFHCMEEKEENIPRLESLVVVRRRRGPVSGFDVVGPISKQEEVLVELKGFGAKEQGDKERTLFRLSAAIPSFPEEINENGVFLESGLREAVSFNKGCYVGQEVIEKVDTIGKLPQVLKCVKFEKLVFLERGEVIKLVLGKAEGIEELRAKVVTVSHDEENKFTLVFILVKNVERLSMVDEIRIQGARGSFLSQQVSEY